MTRKRERRYQAKALLWHTAEGRYVGAGEEVDLSHLSPGDIARLVEAGLVEIVKEENNGTNGKCDLSEGLQG